MNLFNDFECKNISGLTFNLKVIYIDNYFKNKNESILVVTSSLYEANKFYQSLLKLNNNVLLFPMDDFLTSEALAISPELKINRLETISELCNDNKNIVVTNLMGFLRYLPKKEMFIKKKIFLKTNDDFSIKKLNEELFDLGYEKQVLVNKTGEYASRGFIIDIFPVSYDNPIRIEFWGDTIESIREFDVDTQLTIRTLNEVYIFPASEMIIDANVDRFGLSHREITKFGPVESISDYVSNNIIYDDYDNIESSYRFIEEEIFNYNSSENRSNDTKYMNELVYKESAKNLANYDNNSLDKVNTKTYESHKIELLGNNKEEINKTINMYLNKYNYVCICAHNLKDANKIIDFLDNRNIILTDNVNKINNKVNLIITALDEGFLFQGEVYISQNDIFGNKKENHYKSKFKLGSKIRDITKLNVGDYVVHSIHGVGRYQGIKSLVKNGLNKDYLLVVYKNDDKLYIPAERIDLISKFSPKDGFEPKLNKLGSLEWEKTKLRARKKIEDIAAQLMELYAIRESIKGYSFPKDNDEQISFEKEFTYKETFDQLKVIEEIKKDMEKESPMDRLLCGDVGYGKTEVAFRAIFKAIISNKQAAILCPTTILSNQHYINALERFKSFPVNIEIVNRFVSNKKIESVLKRLKEGKVDLLIGTHRLLSEDVIFKDLGLLVIDEEQRFGVKHKEKIKNYKNNVDVLTLSATPIPRTLQMSMAGIRSLSLIETPPTDRYPIQTYVLSENNQVIKDAIYKEISRDGQCFILFNNIEKMEEKKLEIERLVPDAKVVCAHGKMSKNELEDIMNDFTNNLFNILLCTTIIETGIDIPNVNTLIIYDANNFGLSQLYQIRGRVGRSNKIAYCYLMYDKRKILSEIAVKRLNAIKEFTELGSGFSIAMRDLAIRGAGDILGSEQAGFVDTIGIELFMEMLNQEVNKLKGIEVVEEEKEEENAILDVATSISDNYVNEEDLKIEIHKKINSIDSMEKLDIVKKELEDRFGKIDETLIIYMYEELFENTVKKIGLKNIKQTKNFIEIHIDSEKLIDLDTQNLFVKVTNLSRMFRFSMKNNNLIVTLDTVKLDRHFIYYMLDFLNIYINSKK